MADLGGYVSRTTDPPFIAVGAVLLLVWVLMLVAQGRLAFRLRTDQYEVLTFIFLPAKIVMCAACVGCGLTQGFVSGQWWFQNLNSPEVEIVAAVVVQGLLRPLWFYAACYLLLSNLSTIVASVGPLDAASCCSKSATAAVRVAPTETAFVPIPPAPGSQQIDASRTRPAGMGAGQENYCDDTYSFYDGERAGHGGWRGGHPDDELPCVEPLAEGHREPCSPTGTAQERWFLRARRQFIVGFGPWAAGVAVWAVIHIALAVAEADARRTLKRDVIWCADPPSSFNAHVVSCCAVLSNHTFRHVLPKSFEIVQLLFVISSIGLWGWLGGHHSRTMLQAATQSRFYHLYGAVLVLLSAEGIVRIVALFSFARSGWPNAVVALAGALLDMGLYTSLQSRVVGLAEAHPRASRSS